MIKETIIIGNDLIEVVIKEFDYLSFLISNNGDGKKEVNIRFGMGTKIK